MRCEFLRSSYVAGCEIFSLGLWQFDSTRNKDLGLVENAQRARLGKLFPRGRWGPRGLREVREIGLDLEITGIHVAQAARSIFAVRGFRGPQTAHGTYRSGVLGACGRQFGRFRTVLCNLRTPAANCSCKSADDFACNASANSDLIQSWNN